MHPKHAADPSLKPRTYNLLVPLFAFVAETGVLASGEHFLVLCAVWLLSALFCQETLEGKD